MNMKQLFVSGLAFMLISCDPGTEETTPIRKDITEMVFASGILEAAHTYNLTAQTDGYLLKLNFEEGDIVEAGTVFAEVENPENAFTYESSEKLYRISESNANPNAPAIAQAKHAMLIAKNQFESDSVQAKRYELLYQNNSVSKVEVESYQLKFESSRINYLSARESLKLTQQQAEQNLISSRASKNISGRNLSNNKIRTVVKGKVYKKLKEAGDYVKRGDVLATIGDADFIYARINVDESNISRIRVGQDAVIQLNTDKLKNYKAEVAEIYPSFDEASQSFLCKLTFIDSLDFKITGTQLQSNIIIGQQSQALLIPRNYLDYDGTVTLSANQEKVSVVTHFIGEEWVQVLSGINEHTKLITSNIKANKMNTSELGSQMR